MMQSPREKISNPRGVSFYRFTGRGVEGKKLGRGRLLGGGEFGE